MNMRWFLLLLLTLSYYSAFAERVELRGETQFHPPERVEMETKRLVTIRQDDAVLIFHDGERVLPSHAPSEWIDQEQTERSTPPAKAGTLAIIRNSDSTAPFTNYNLVQRRDTRSLSARELASELVSGTSTEGKKVDGQRPSAIAGPSARVLPTSPSSAQVGSPTSLEGAPSPEALKKMYSFRMGEEMPGVEMPDIETLEADIEELRETMNIR
jgi:hypothetical protein